MPTIQKDIEEQQAVPKLTSNYVTAHVLRSLKQALVDVEVGPREMCVMWGARVQVGPRTPGEAKVDRNRNIVEYKNPGRYIPILFLRYILGVPHPGPLSLGGQVWGLHHGQCFFQLTCLGFRV